MSIVDPHPSTTTTPAPTTAGNYFVANYPPFSCWTGEQVSAVRERLAHAAETPPPLGIYVHLPFCRQRCDFCYYKVYTDKNAREIARYLDCVAAELTRYAEQPYLAGRKPSFVYYGGGTPSYLSSDQIEKLFAAVRAAFPCDAVEEITFECEPGTLTEKKVQVLRSLGVTRVSLGVEHFDPEILELNNRAHRAVEIDRAWGMLRAAGFPQINLDLISGMVGETDERWRRTIERTLELHPDQITIYQMEIPYNTTIYQRMKAGEAQVAPVADWETKRRWSEEAFSALGRAGYLRGSAYTAMASAEARFLYRDALWHGSDLVPIGVSSFGHLGGVHLQNEHRFEPYIERVEKGELPIHRAYQLSADERLIRELVLQMKLGRVRATAFQEKFGVDPRVRFADALRAHEAAGWLHVRGEWIELTPQGLARVETLLPPFFLPQHRDVRYA
jgi:oxygen-independent coproporphyrinogen-3 oxidase